MKPSKRRKTRADTIRGHLSAPAKFAKKESCCVIPNQGKRYRASIRVAWKMKRHEHESREQGPGGSAISLTRAGSLGDKLDWTRTRGKEELQIRAHMEGSAH